MCGHFLARTYPRTSHLASLHCTRRRILALSGWRGRHSHQALFGWWKQTLTSIATRSLHAQQAHHMLSRPIAHASRITTAVANVTSLLASELLLLMCIHVEVISLFIALMCAHAVKRLRLQVLSCSCTANLSVCIHVIHLRLCAPETETHTRAIRGVRLTSCCYL